MQNSDKGPNLIDSSEIISKKIFVAIKESGKSKDEISNPKSILPRNTRTPDTYSGKSVRVQRNCTGDSTEYSIP